MIKLYFLRKYARAIKHNSLALIQSLHYDSPVTQNTLDICTLTIENTDNDVLDT